MPKLLAAILSSFVAYVPHALFGDSLDPMMDFVLSTVVGGAAYIFMLWWFGRLRGDY